MNVQTIALDYAEKQKLSNKKIFILEEGGSQLESLPGALSLPLDILRNQNDLQLHFDHIIIETGTGMMASTLILGMNLLQSRLKAHIHVLLLAGDESSFHQQLHKWHHSFNALVNLNSPFPQNFTLHRPNQAPSFGSTNQRIFEEIRILGQTEGFFCDPIYSGKLMLESRKLLHDQKMQGDVLLIHSGGGLTLMGFQNKLLKNY
jgi:1-aminocyclopropane-1-carboxylate deaminase/D-cysteine desulfhydrase-like pyridoxal-dependent ACC family enzyme